MSPPILWSYSTASRASRPSLPKNTDKSFVRFGSASARWDYRAENVPENAEELLLSVERTYAVPPAMTA